MGIEIQGGQSPVGPGNLVQFNFQNPVWAYTLGISAFKLSYGSGVDHWIQNFQIKMLPSQGLIAAPNQVSATVQMELQDSSGHTIDTADSFIWPVCIAVTGSNQEPDTVMSNATGIPSGSYQTVTLPLQSSAYTPATSFLSGFNLSFSNTDHQVLQAASGCGLTYNGTAGQLSSLANLSDASGNQVQTATIDAGYMASSYTSPGFGIGEISSETIQSVSVPIQALNSISQAVVLIRNWNVQFDSVHNVQTVQVGSWGDLTFSSASNVVTLPNLYAEMFDNSGHYQDDAKSSCDVIVFALP